MVILIIHARSQVLYLALLNTETKFSRRTRSTKVSILELVQTWYEDSGFHMAGAKMHVSYCGQNRTWK